MAAASPRQAKPGSGRPTGRARAGARPAPVSATEETQPIETGDKQPRLALTGRLIALVCVLALMGLFYAPTIRIYLDQSHQIALQQQAIAERTAEIERLSTELARWEDPAYIKAQARNRLGWVMPGETGYRVIDANGTPLGNGVELQDTSNTTDLVGTTWWGRMWGSVEAADHPVAK
ncbi:MAG: septum formation initiator family protein [Propionibacteriaceae bacterium]|jgi:cell division protein FtsB|nr:septum formation initiator family protein [Propionibacteriaceae bacterium]